MTQSANTQQAAPKGLERLYQWWLKSFFMRRIWPHCIDWTWVKNLFYWFIKNVGHTSEALFVAATLWVCFDKYIHSFLVGLLGGGTTGEQAVQHYTDLSMTVFIALPVLLVATTLAVAIEHGLTWNYSQWKDKWAAVWMVSYGVPVALFLTLDFTVIWLASSGDHTAMPGWVTSLRIATGVTLGMVSFLHWKLGTKKEVDRLREKDDFNAQLVENCRLMDEQIETLKIEMEDQRLSLVDQMAQLRLEKDSEIANQKQQLTGQIEVLNQLIDQQKQVISTAKKEILHQSETALQAYSQECIDWLNSGNKTVDFNEIVRYTGHNHQTVTWAVKKGDIKKSPGKSKRYMLASVADWLKKTPPPSFDQNEDITPLSESILTDQADMSFSHNGHLEQDTEPISVDELAQMMK